jgi:hypothetical protein
MAASPAVADRPAAQVQLRGILDVAHSDDFRHGRARYSYALRIGAGSVKLRFAGRGPVRLGGARVSVHGSVAGDAVRVERNGLHLEQRRPSRRFSTFAATGARKVAVILFNFPDDRSQPFSVDQVRQVMFSGPDSVNAYYQEQSYGRLAFTGKLRSDGDVFGWYPIGVDSSGCRMQEWAQAARQAATAAGVDLTGYDHLVYAFPHTASCDWYGQAMISGSESWINGVFNRYVVGHELGHNLGLEHASALVCSAAGARVAISPECSRDEYGDPFDIMGSGARHMSSWHKGTLGWLGASNTQTVSASGTYAVAPLEASSLGVQTLRIPRGNTGTYYTLEYRQPYGSFFDNFPAGDPAVNGVTIRLCPDYGVDARSLLVDATPETSTFLDAALPAGRTFYDPAYRLLIRTEGVSPFDATVAVAFDADPPPPPPPPPPVPDTTPPTAPAEPSAQTKPGPSVKPEPLRLRARTLVRSPDRPVAGRLFAARITVRRTDNGELLRQGEVTCPAHVRGRAVAAASAYLRRGRAVCSWRLPRAAHGSRLVAAVVVEYRGASLSRRLAARLR